MTTFSRNALRPLHYFAFSRRRFSTASRLKLRDINALENGNVEFFREHAFEPSIPSLLPRGHFSDLPALSRWFAPDGEHNVWALNQEYLQSYGDTIVPLELTQFAKDNNGHDTFMRDNAELSVFLTWVTRNTPGISVYLAQAPIANLCKELRRDFPVPEIVSRGGRGDIYNTGLWMGRPPTYTPLHKDPNPNLFVQLAGQKVVRLFEPDVGLEIFDRVSKSIGRAPGGSSAIRGEEMMKGEEKRVLEQVVWGDEHQEGGLEVHLDRGDGLFIPKGWWHSVKGIGEGITASVNWWFR